MFNLNARAGVDAVRGRDPQTGRQIGLATPPLDEMGSMEELEAAYDRQLIHFIDLMVQGCNIVDRLHAEILRHRSCP